MCLDEIAGVGGRVVGAAARAGDHGARRTGAQARAEFGEQRGILRELRGDHGRTLGRLEEHPCRFIHDDALSSATKS